METGFIILTTLMVLFALLAIFDGFFLHIFRFELHKYDESKQEHLMHTFRAVIFPAMVFFLFVVQNCTLCFYIGLVLVLLDIIILGIDAYMEKTVEHLWVDYHGGNIYYISLLMGFILQPLRYF